MVQMKSLKFFFLCTLLFSCMKERESRIQFSYKESSEIKEYIFGVHPLHNPKLLHEVFGPLIEYLNKNLDGSFFILEGSRSYKEFDDKMKSGRFHVSLPNPYQTYLAIKQGYSVFGKMGDDDNFRGIILTRKDRRFKNVSELNKGTLCFPAPTALAATLMPLKYLVENGVVLNNQLKIKYLGSQESSILGVYNKTCDASGTWPPPWESYIEEHPEVEKDLVVSWQTKPLINNGLVYRLDLSKGLLEKVKNLILDLHKNDEGRSILKKMKLSRFEMATNQNYEVVHHFMNSFHHIISEDQI